MFKDLSKGLEISEEDAELTKIMHGSLHHLMMSQLKLALIHKIKTSEIYY